MVCESLFYLVGNLYRGIAVLEPLAEGVMLSLGGPAVMS